MISKNTQILHLVIKRPLFDHHFWKLFMSKKNDLFDFKSVGWVVTGHFVARNFSPGRNIGPEFLVPRIFPRSRLYCQYF